MQRRYLTFQSLGWLAVLIDKNFQKFGCPNLLNVLTVLTDWFSFADKRTSHFFSSVSPHWEKNDIFSPFVKIRMPKLHFLYHLNSLNVQSRHLPQYISMYTRPNVSPYVYRRECMRRLQMKSFLKKEIKKNYRVKF